MKMFHRISTLIFLFATAAVLASGQAVSTAAEKGSQTAKAGFKNETEIAAKLNNWKQDDEATQWLVVMGYSPREVLDVKASKPHGKKTDVQVVIKTPKGEFTEGISIKLVSNPSGFNQIDKRWLQSYAAAWKL